jgi:hypothetical protein
MDKQVIITDNEMARQHVMRRIDCAKAYKVTIEEVKEKDLRSIPQNSAMHVFFALEADSLNAAGLDVKTVLDRKSVESPWTPELFKSLIWSAVQKAMFGDTRTSKLKMEDVTKVHAVVSRHLSQNLGAEYIPFPSAKG